MAILVENVLLIYIYFLEEKRPSVFDRLGGAKPIPITRNEPAKKERCKYWPNCKNGEECIYFHPTTVCPYVHASKILIENVVTNTLFIL